MKSEDFEKIFTFIKEQNNELKDDLSKIDDRLTIVQDAIVRLESRQNQDYVSLGLRINRVEGEVSNHSSDKTIHNL